MTEESPAERDAECSEALFDAFFNSCYTSAVLYVQCREPGADAEHIVEEAFLEIFKRWDEIENRRGYLYAILRNGVATHHRMLNRESRLREELVASWPRETSQDPLEMKIIYDEVMDAFQQLSGREREIAVMRWMLHWTPDEIADQLGISRSTVSTHLSKATRRLQEIFGNTRTKQRSAEGDR
ncbi:sigma-70 family RNA polymerase sigma factor [Streptomyces sp. NBC_01210]|uniref:RNA polymerase sigma factor n=1 Tax=Streptomyces sp. NBC_01210 TaxID=2903774 RepID=UPI002E163D84|nr:sigma-70 family RNA polymerase sigma factor [Streptomyces sp. NBC_01210]